LKVITPLSLGEGLGVRLERGVRLLRLGEKLVEASLIIPL